MAIPTQAPKRALLAALLFLGASILGVACDSSHDAITSANLAENCSLDSDCTSPLVCAFQTCHIQCETTADCRAQSLGLCIESDRPYKVCQNPTEENCTRNSDCAGTEVCAADEKCRDACATSKDCVTGQSCVTGVCVDPVDLVDGGLVQTDAGSEGQACYFAHDCPRNLVCLRGTCTVECVTDKDCEISFTCQNTRCTPPSDDTSDAAVSDRMDSSAEDASDAALDSSTICPVGQTYCGLSCIDPTSSDAFCHAAGACGTGCLPGERCTAGVCQCLAPKTLCDGKTCVDLASDSANCRTCDHSCALPNEMDNACSGGQCTGGACVAGFADCDGDATNGCELNVQSDPANCGACGAACTIGGCTNGQCQVTVLAVTPDAYYLAIDATNVYWTGAGTFDGNMHNADGTIMTVPVAGGTPTTLASGQLGPSYIAVDASNVYWFDMGATDFTGQGSIMKVAKTGGAVTTLASDVNANGSENGIVTDGTNVYWVDYNNGLIQSVPVVGGATVTLASGITTPEGIAADGTYVYFSETYANRISRIPRGGGTVSDVATGQNLPQVIAVDGTYVYWGNFPTMTNGMYNDDAAIVRAPLAGGTPVTLATGGTQIESITVDSTYVYFTSDSVNLSRVPIAGGPVTVLVPSANPISLVVDASSLYWIYGNDTEDVVKLATH